MKARYLILTAVALLLLHGTDSWCGQKNTASTRRCMRALNRKVQLDDWIRVTSHDGHSFEGTLRAIGFTHLRLTLMPKTDADTAVGSCNFEEIARLQYHGTGKVKPAFLSGGLVLGAVCGAAIEGSTAGSDSDSSFDFGNIGAGMVGSLLGGLIGMTVGAVISTETQSTFTIKCE